MKSAKAAKHAQSQHASSLQNIPVKVDPHECPFREFRDNELSPDYWGMGPQEIRLATVPGAVKSTIEQIWYDEQTQPLPQSVRKFLYEWRRAEDVAQAKYECEVVPFEDNDSSKISLVEMQLTHPMVLKRSSFVRKVLSVCFMLERCENFMTEHQWENFSCNFHEGWRPKYLIYSPNMKPGGGIQHRASLSKTGCYLVRLYYLGAWRCVWVNDQVPVTFMGAPLLPFAPLITPSKTGPVGKSLTNNVTSSTIHLWPLLLCKALLKLAAPDISANNFDDEDEEMSEFSIMHALTGCMMLTYKYIGEVNLWTHLCAKVQMFVWDEDEETTVSVAKRSIKNKPVAKDVPVRTCMVSVVINDTAEYPPYKLPGITPAFEMELIITMCRDLPLKKPPPEPEVPLWKTYRWVDWARRHGLYDEYECPRIRFLKVNGLLKLSHAPHLLDVGSTESITQAFRIEQEQGQTTKRERKAQEERIKEKDMAAAQSLQMKEELREWILFDSIMDIVKELHVTYFPSQFQFTTCTSHQVIRIQKVPNKSLDVLNLKISPLYLQLDSATNNLIRISLTALHPRILLNCNVPIEYYVEPTYLLLEEFDWFDKPKLVRTKAFVQTRGYDTIDVNFTPGRHYCRIWVHSHVHWHVAILSESTLMVGTRDVILCASARECQWASTFLNNLGSAFSTWSKINRTVPNVMSFDREFFKSYQPDLTWDPHVVGYSQKLLHWMFRQALQTMLFSALTPVEFNYVCGVLRGMFRDPEFGIFKDEKPVRWPLREIKSIAGEDPCVCPTPEGSDLIVAGQQQSDRTISEKSRSGSAQSEVIIAPPLNIMDQLFTPSDIQGASNVCDIATDDMPCSYLREERQKEIIRHEAAIMIQKNWRGTYARKIIRRPQPITPDILKLLNERCFGHIESLSALMNEFFRMYPTTQSAYTVSSGLSGTNGLRQYTGITHAGPKCQWIPYFQGTFYCHTPGKIHFDLVSSIPYSTFKVFNNDTERKLPTCYNAHFTYDIDPNEHGYTVMGHGTQKEDPGIPQDLNWQLTVLTSHDRTFHVCDNDEELCRELPILTPSYKLRVEEVFLPNRKNILGSIQLLVTNHEFVNFRAVASSPDLEMIAYLRPLDMEVGEETEELMSCAGRGEIYWPFIHVEGRRTALIGKKSISWGPSDTHKLSMRSSKGLIKQTQKLKTVPTKGGKPKGPKDSPELPNEYKIEVIAPYGWPLHVVQWKRVDEIHNIAEFVPPSEPSSAKKTKDKVSIKEKKEDKREKDTPPPPQHKPHEGDAFITLECSYPESGHVMSHRDDSRDLEYWNSLRSWEFDEAGRNLRGADIRQAFRDEYLEKKEVPKHSMSDVYTFEEEDTLSAIHQGPSLASELLMEGESVTSASTVGLTMPEILKDKFKPLTFVQECTREKLDKPGLLYTLALADVEKLDRHERIQEALERMRELQVFNEVHQLARQKKRFRVLEPLFVDSTWNTALTDVFEAQKDAIAQEALARSLSAAKKTKTQTSANASVAGKRGGRGGRAKK